MCVVGLKLKWIIYEFHFFMVVQNAEFKGSGFFQWIDIEAPVWTTNLINELLNEKKKIGTENDGVKEVAQG